MSSLVQWRMRPAQREGHDNVQCAARSSGRDLCSHVLLGSAPECRLLHGIIHVYRREEQTEAGQVLICYDFNTPIWIPRVNPL